MKEIGMQFLQIWKEVKPLQKVIAISILLFVCGMLALLVFKSIPSSYLALDVSPSEKSDVRLYLENNGISFREDLERGILVPEDQLERIQRELTATRGGQRNQGKGFELFDTNTWIKGEKELQVLEMRALKGQLEKDLADFDQIKSARVILDLSTGRTFGKNQHKTKASVILTLMPNVYLTTPQLRAITYHLAGAVRGLEPSMIAISDTSGRLYKAIDPEGEEEYLSHAALSFEEHLKQKIELFLNAIIPKKSFFVMADASMEKEEKRPHALSIFVALDHDSMHLVPEIERCIGAMVVDVPFSLNIEAIAFKKKAGSGIKLKKGRGYVGLVVILISILIAVGFLYPVFRRYSKRRQEEALFGVMTRVDIAKLAEAIQEEDPETIALMLSYLEPKRAEEMIAAFPDELQEKILVLLTQFEAEV